MAEPFSHRDNERDTRNDPERGAPAGMPRWVKVSGAIVALLVVALVAIALVRGQNHGPGRHASGDLCTEQFTPIAFGEGAPGGGGLSDLVLG